MISNELLERLLEMNAQALHPSKGKQNAQLVREVCDAAGLDEDRFLPRHVVRNKKEWGLT